MVHVEGYLVYVIDHEVLGIVCVRTTSDKLAKRLSVYDIKATLRGLNVLGGAIGQHYTAQEFLKKYPAPSPLPI